jgi:hypothetical protein
LFFDMDAGTASAPTTMATDLEDGALSLCNPQSGNNHNIEVVEVLANKGPLTDGEHAKLVGYFRDKFGF